jgi:hypothetical protein
MNYIEFSPVAGESKKWRLTETPSSRLADVPKRCLASPGLIIDNVLFVGAFSSLRTRSNPLEIMNRIGGRVSGRLVTI